MCCLVFFVFSFGGEGGVRKGADSKNGGLGRERSWRAWLASVRERVIWRDKERIGLVCCEG